MGIYFNPDNESFRKDCQSRLYVDKTGLVGEMNRVLSEAQNCIAVSHARRFGKSQAARMLEAYYSRGCDSRSLFEPFTLSREPDWDRYLNKLNVIHLDISSQVNVHKEKLVEGMVRTIYRELGQEYQQLLPVEEGLPAILGDVFKQSGIPFVIILDEWDCVVRNYADKPKFVHEYMQFLHDLFKSEEAKHFLVLGYITGILPIKKIRDESALNNFREFTMVNSKRLAGFFGFTEAEVQALCSRYGMEFESVKKWYDGYLINGRHMYNPNSVSQAMQDGMLCSYWKNTSSFEAINQYITLDYAGLKQDVVKMLEGGKVRVNVEPFQNDLQEIHSKDDALAALIHLGYLGYDADSKRAFMPNYEVATAFQDALVTGVWPELARIMNRCDDTLESTLELDADRVAQNIEMAHETYTSVIEYNNENALSCVVTMAYFTAQAYYNIEREFPSGKGFADIVMLPRRDVTNRPALLIELKWDRDADTALRQIKEKRYAGKLAGYSSRLLLVGINYDKETKAHTCVIEERV